MHSRDYKYSQTRPLQLSLLLCIWHKYNWNIPEDRYVTFFQVFWVSIYGTQGISIKKNAYLQQISKPSLGKHEGKVFTWQSILSFKNTSIVTIKYIVHIIYITYNFIFYRYIKYIIFFFIAEILFRKSREHSMHIATFMKWLEMCEGRTTMGYYDTALWGMPRE